MNELLKKAMAFAVEDITGRTLRPEVLESMLDDFNKKNISSEIPVFKTKEWEETMSDFFDFKLKT